MSYNSIIDLASVKKKTVEYQTESGALPVDKNQLVKIAPKGSKKQRKSAATAKPTSEQKQELDALLASP